MTTADIHIHTTYSPDSIIKPQELVRKAKACGLDIVCVTDHNIFEENVGLEYFNRMDKTPLIIRGVELATSHGELIIFGLRKNFWEDLKRGMEMLPLTEKVIDAVKSFDGLAIWPHPFREYTMMSYNIEYKDIKDVYIMETLNAHNSDEENKKAYAYAKKHGFKMLGGSDAHNPEEIAQALTLFKDDIECEEDFIYALKNSFYTPITYRDLMGKDLKELLKQRMES